MPHDTKMDPELKANWVAALRSGEFKQGRHNLYNPFENSYCCLGVLCVVAGRDVPVAGEHGPHYDFARGALGERAGALIGMNDRSEAKTFLEIADYIEEHL